MLRSVPMDLFEQLDKHLPYRRFDHPAVFTCEQAEQLLQGVPGQGAKNLFIRGIKRGEHFVVTIADHKRADLKALGKQLGVGRVEFAPAEEMKEFLGVDPGSVTPLGVVNDHNRRVRFILDSELYPDTEIHVHPLVNTATLVVRSGDLEKFFRTIDRELEIVAIPARASA